MGTLPQVDAGGVTETAKPVKKSSGWGVLWFIAHLAAVYVVANFGAPWLAGWLGGRVFPFLEIPTRSSSRYEFLFSHLLILSIIPGFIAGLLNARFKHKAALFVWMVPSVILTYKLLTFSAATSVLQSNGPLAFHHYFGGDFLIPEFHDWKEFWTSAASNPDMARGLAQITFTAPFYAAVAYSAAAWVSMRSDLDRKIIGKLRAWEEWKFGNRD